MTSQRIIIITTIAAMLTAIGSPAADFPIVTGHGDTQWGQSREEVKTIIPALVEIDGVPQVLRLEGKADDIIQRTGYMFSGDKLFAVIVNMKMPGATEGQKDENGLRYVKEQLDAKYADARVALASARIAINAGHGKSGEIRVIYRNDRIEQQDARQQREDVKAEKEKAYQESGRSDVLESAGVNDLL
jgi:hypothetical protein